LIKIPYSRDEQEILLDIAKRSIRHGLSHGRALEPDLSVYDENLLAPAATFVTLETQGRLRGCIGTVRAIRPLLLDVAENAWSAAFQDPRFDPLSMKEFSALEIEISILSEPELMSHSSEADLREQVIPGSDGLIISEGTHQALFLPAVWDKLPDIHSFLSQLKLKAGLDRDYWSDTMEVKRFKTYKIHHR